MIYGSGTFPCSYSSEIRSIPPERPPGFPGVFAL